MNQGRHFVAHDMASQLSSWPCPTSVWKASSVPVRTPLPIYPPPEDKLASLPPLPTPQRQPNVHPSFVLSTHLVPAAYLRTTRCVPLPPAPMIPSDDPGLSKKERIRKLMQVKEWMENIRGSDVEGKRGYERILWVCVNRYHRVDLDEFSSNGRRRGFTLFFAHGTGFPKEVSMHSLSGNCVNGLV